MQTLIICILTNTLIGFIFKMFPRYGVNTLQAIVVNYFVCVLMAALVLGENPIVENVHQKEWFPYALFLGFIFISGFNINAFSVRNFGVTLTTIMQKMSLILTVPVAIWMYNESINGWKIAGLIAGLIAIYLTNLPAEGWGGGRGTGDDGRRTADDKRLTTKSLPSIVSRQSSVVRRPSSAVSRPPWMLGIPIVVLLVAVMIETTLQYVEIKILGGSGGIKFVATLFGIAGLLGLVVAIAGLVSGRLTFSYKNIIAGVVLGVPNFFSIYYIIKAISEGWQGSEFFPYNNISIIALSALIAYLFFQEKLSTLNIVGVLLSIAAIGLIAMSNVQ